MPLVFVTRETEGDREPYEILFAMRLYFIRHAQSANNALYDTTGSDAGRSDDPELTPAGERQAALLGAFIGANSDPLESGGYGLTHVYTSPMVRAVNTALEVANAAKLEPMVWDDWHEVGGIWNTNDSGERVGREGKNRAYFADRFPRVRVPGGWGVDRGWWSRPHESEEAYMPRAKRAWAELLSRHGGTHDRVAVVSHGYFFALLMAAVLELPDLGPFWFMMNNTGLTRFDVRENEYDNVRVAYMNRLSHLPDDLVT
jgi:2,3-bisphosphoglycerate-dependent phosphoglycerate mutase